MECVDSDGVALFRPGQELTRFLRWNEGSQLVTPPAIVGDSGAVGRDNRGTSEFSP